MESDTRSDPIRVGHSSSLMSVPSPGIIRMGHMPFSFRMGPSSRVAITTHAEEVLSDGPNSENGMKGNQPGRERLHQIMGSGFRNGSRRSRFSKGRKLHRSRRLPMKQESFSGMVNRSHSSLTPSIRSMKVTGWLPSVWRCHSLPGQSSTQRGSMSRSPVSQGRGRVTPSTRCCSSFLQRTGLMAG